jgi:hypothetical protein
MNKMRITKVGVVKNGVAMYWEFSAEGTSRETAAIQLEKGLIAGYTLAELTEISQRHQADKASKFLQKCECEK